MEEKKKSNPVSIWNNLTLTINCLFAARTDEKKCKPTWRKLCKAFSWCEWFTFIILLVKSVAKVNSTVGRWTRMKQDTFSKDSFRPRNCSSYQVCYIGFSSGGHISQCCISAKISYHVSSFPTCVLVLSQGKCYLCHWRAQDLLKRAASLEKVACLYNCEKLQNKKKSCDLCCIWRLSLPCDFSLTSYFTYLQYVCFLQRGITAIICNVAPFGKRVKTLAVMLNVLMSTGTFLCSQNQASNA